jgi:hypothetical protein
MGETRSARSGIQLLRAMFAAGFWLWTHRGESSLANQKYTLTLAVVSALLAGSSAAQEEPDWDFDFDLDGVDETLPGGFEILEKYADAIGGAEAYKSIETMHLTGTLDMPAAGIVGAQISISCRAPNSRHVQIDIEGIGQVMYATDGKQAWMMQPGLPEPTLLEDVAAESLIYQADLLLDVEPRRKYSFAETLYTVDHDGTPCYHVKIITETGEQHGYALFEVESGLKREEAYKSSPDHLVHISVTSYSDYRQEGELLHAWRMDILEGSDEQTLTISKVEHNIELDGDLFDPPTTE